MKSISLFLAVVIFTSFTVPSGTTWYTNFEEAKSEASQTKKYILLNFSGSDWCAPCIRLKSEIFSSEKFLAFAEDNLVLANADFPRLKKNQLEKSQVRQNEALADKYNPEGKFPLTILLNADGKAVMTWEGLPQKSPEQFVDEIKRTIAAHTETSTHAAK